MKWGIKQLNKRRVAFARADAQAEARLVDIAATFNKPDASGHKVKIRGAEEIKNMKNHTEILQEILCAISSDDNAQYGIIEYPLVLDAYTQMHETGFLARSQHKAIAKHLSRHLRYQDSKDIKCLTAIIAWHMIQSGEQPVFQENIDELFPEHENSALDTSIDAGLTRIMS